MSKVRSSRPSALSLAFRKVFVSGFVVFSFIAYAVHDRLINVDPANDNRTPAVTGGQAHVMVSTPQEATPVKQTIPTSQYIAPTLQTNSIPTSTATEQPTETPFIPTQTPLPPTATDQPKGQFRDGVYTGPTVNAFYGLVQVQATVQDGKLTDVQFLQFPNDRRTSQRINQIAMPYLTQEAVQVQSARVHIVSGATLTSEAFAQSLYSILTTDAAY